MANLPDCRLTEDCSGELVAVFCSFMDLAATASDGEEFAKLQSIPFGSSSHRRPAGASDVARVTRYGCAGDGRGGRREEEVDHFGNFSRNDPAGLWECVREDREIASLRAIL